MFLSRLVLALFVAALSTTITFAANTQSNTSSEEPVVVSENDEDITLEDEELAD